MTKHLQILNFYFWEVLQVRGIKQTLTETLNETANFPSKENNDHVIIVICQIQGHNQQPVSLS